MIGPELRAEIRRLVLRDGWKIETVARRFGVHHSVVRRAVRDEPSGGSAPPVASALDPYKPYIVERLTQAPELTAVRLLLEVRDRGYRHSLTILRRYVAQVRAPRLRKAFLRVETEPGEVAQVDWGSFGRMRVGNTYRPLSAFAMVLHWSRALYVDFSLDMHMDTFLRMHQRALAFYGGVPKKIIYDTRISAASSAATTRPSASASLPTSGEWSRPFNYLRRQPDRSRCRRSDGGLRLRHSAAPIAIASFAAVALGAVDPPRFPTLVSTLVLTNGNDRAVVQFDHAVH
jgi:transposase